tara:strand:- start:571 stop:1254 length:684 start_codon:yes stop_codon:yes gene_type:complete
MFSPITKNRSHSVSFNERFDHTNLFDTSYPSSPPKTEIPLWKQQEQARRKLVHKQTILSTSREQNERCAITGQLVGFKLAKPMKPQKKSHQSIVRKSITNLSAEKMEEYARMHEEIVTSVINTADQGTNDGSVSINELQIFLKNTIHHRFMEWLTGLSDGNTSRFHELDEDGSHSIEKEELKVAVIEFYTEVAQASFEMDYELSIENNARRLQAKEDKKVKRRITQR